MLTLRIHPDHKSLTDFVTCGVPAIRVRREYANSNIKDVSGIWRSKAIKNCRAFQLTGKAVAGPRSEFGEVLEREESLNSGVYFLT